MDRRWFFFILCGLLLAISAGAVIDAQQAIARQTRGWEQATRQPELPLRTPLAGVNVELTQYSPDELAAQLNAIAELGFYWVRQPIYWERVEAQPGDYDWTAYDRVIQAVAAHPDLEMVAVLDGTPPWARHALAPAHPFAPPASVQQFADFAAAVASRYHDALAYYQIWDEPNIRTHWGNLDPRPAAYVAMLQQAYTAIHAADDDAQVIMAALAPTVETGPHNLSDLLFLQAVYDLGGGAAFDAAAAKPYGYDTAPNDRTVSPDVLNFSRIILLREEMLRRGDGHKPLWGSNFGWNHLPADWTGPPSIWGQVGAETQIDWTLAAYQRAATEWPWLGGLILQHWQPDAPPDDPVQSFAVAPRRDAWQAAITAQGGFVPDDGLVAGHHPAQTPHTRYDGYWRFSKLGADARPDVPDGVDVQAVRNTITVDFYGTAFAIKTRRDDYLAYLEVSIDGQPANALPRNSEGAAFLVLTSPTRQPRIDLIPVAEGLPPGKHTAIITHRPALGDDRWPVAGFAVASAPDTTVATRQSYAGAGIGLLGLVAGLLVATRLPWRHVRPPSRQALIDLGDWALTYLVSMLFIVSVVLSWDGMVNNFLRRDPPALLVTIAALSVAYWSPPVWLSLAGLLAVGIIVFNRPVMGLLAVLFWSIFFTATLDLHIRLIAVLEVLLALTVVAVVGRWLSDWAARRRGQTQPLAFEWPTLHGLDVGLAAFGLLAVLSLTWVELLPEAFRELRTMVLGPLVFYALLRITRLERREWLLLADVVVLGGATIAVIGLYNYVTEEYVVYTAEGARRLIGVYGSPNSVALHLGRCLPFGVAYLLLDNGWRRVYGGAAALLMGIAILLTQSVGALVLGVPAALAVIVLGWQGRRALLPLAGLAGAGLLALVPLARFIPRLGNLLNFDNQTTRFRLNLWRSTAELLQDHPLLGVGLDQFLYAYRGRYILPQAWADPDLSHPHNLFLDYWVRLGILGLLVGIWLQLLFWRTALTAYRRLRGADSLLLALVLGAMGSMANFLAHGLVDTAYFAINLAYIFVLCLALVVWAANEPVTEQTTSENGERT